MLLEVVEETAALFRSRKEVTWDPGRAREHDLPMQLTFVRGGVAAASVTPPGEDIATVRAVLRSGGAGFEADVVTVNYEAFVALQDDDADVPLHPLTGDVLQPEDLVSLIVVGGIEAGLVGEGLVTVGANRAGDVEAILELFTPTDGSLLWRSAPRPNAESVANSDVALALRDTMLLPSVQQVAAAGMPALLDEDAYPRERLDCIAAGFLAYEHSCKVSLLSAPGDAARQAGLHRWGRADWDWSS